MKKVVLFAALIAGFALHSAAQQSPSPEKHSRHEKKKKIDSELDLTKQQREEVKAINSDYKDKARKIKENESLSKEQRKEQLSQLHKERKDKMNNILSADQQEKLTKMHKRTHQSKEKKKTKSTR